MTKKSHKRKHSESENNIIVENEPPTKKSTEKKWINKQRILVLATRGINHRDRHLMDDIKKLMPHHKTEPKMERSKTLTVVNEICEIKNCNKALLFEGRKKRDIYLWCANIPNGPSAKFLVENVHTMAELKMTGNCLRSSRPILSFDPSFTEKPHYTLLKELFSQIFGVPKHHPKSQPFFDHVYTFTILDDRIWFRNFQILSEDGALAEVGPRFVLNPVKIFGGSFGGISLWENPKYMSPAKYRRQVVLAAKSKLYVNRKQQKLHAEATKPAVSYKLNPLDEVLKGGPLEMEEAIEANESLVSDDAMEDEQEVTPEPKKVKHKKKGVTKKVSHKIKKFKKPKKQNKV